MPGTHSMRWLVFFVCGALTALGCTTDTPQGESGGSLALDLTIAGGIEIDTVSWEITGGEMEPMSGQINTSAPGSTASVEVFGIPPGEDYLIAMMATATDEETMCKGAAFFDIEVGEVTKVHVMLNCKRPERFGSVRVDGWFNICAELTKVVVSPLQTSVGNDIDLFAQAEDAEDDPITFEWTATGGEIDDENASSTTYTCGEVGEQLIQIMVTDDDDFCDMAEWTVAVECVLGEVECEVDLECADGIQCTNNTCVLGACVTTNADLGDTCDQDGGTVCDGAGSCVECNFDNECGSGEVCEANVCVEEAECTLAPECDDDMQCTLNDCVLGACVTTNEDLGDTCDQDGGTVCDGAGACVECNFKDDCGAEETCVANACVSDPDLFCDTGLCVEDTVLRAECVDKFLLCLADNVDEAECVALSIAICNDCNEDSDCAEGEVCDENKECVPAPDCISPGDCIDGNPCTIGVCTNGMCSFEPVMGGSCDSGTGSGDGSCSAGVCESNDECVADGQCPDDDANECTVPVCVQTGAPYVCDEDSAPADGNECDGGAGTCQSGACEPSAMAVVCEQFNPAPAQTGQTCDGGPGQECICEKTEFIAIDCELVGNSAPLPLAASAQQFGVAFAGQPITILPQDVFAIPATLVCGFIGAGFQSARVDDSEILATYTNANIASTQLSSFLATTSSGGDLISPHGEVFFSFGAACGDNCSGSPLTCKDGTTPCSLSTFTDDCSVENGGAVGTGPGIVAPLFANAPGSIPPGPIPAQLVTLTPTALGSVDIGLPYSGVALNLPDVGGIVSGCIGGACTATQICTPTLRGTEASPRVMYDATCNKLGFVACGGTGCDTTVDCPFNSAAIGGAIPGQTCDTSAGGPDDWLGVCTDVNTGSCGFVAPGVCPDDATSCGSCTDANGSTGDCTVSGPINGARCAVDLDCVFGVNDVCGPPTACADDTGCAATETCELSDDRCNPVIEAISGGAIPTCCTPFGDFTTTADVCKDSLQLEDLASAPPCCDQNLPGASPVIADLFCETAPNKASCCAAIATDYPSATPAQLPQLWVNP